MAILHVRPFDDWDIYTREPEAFTVGELNLLVRVLRERIYQSKLKSVETLWVTEFFDTATDLCSLCANTGWVDTSVTAMSKAGVRPGRRQACICPNGRAMKQLVAREGA